MGMGFQFEQYRLGLWDLSWDLKKTVWWEMGLGPPLHDPLMGEKGEIKIVLRIEMYIPSDFRSLGWPVMILPQKKT